MEHYDAEAEKAVIGQVFLDGVVFDEANLKATHFFDPKHQEIWASFSSLHTDGVLLEPVAVGEHLSRRGVLDVVGGLSYFGEIIAGAPTTSDNVCYYADIIRDYALRRDVSGLPALLARNERATGEEQIRVLRAELDRLEGGISRELPTLAKVLHDEVSDIRHDVESGIKNPTGLLTGLGIENVVPGGLPTNKLIYLFGESGNFKTTGKDNLVWGIAKHNEGTILDCTLEDSNELAAQRALAKETGISYGKIAARDIDVSRLPDLRYDEALASRIIMGGDIPPDTDEIIRQVRYYKRTRGLVAVCIDYIQLLNGCDDHKNLGSAAKKFQQSAKRDNVAYIIVSQVKQDVDQRAQRRESARPRITDMIGSSVLRHSGKVSIGLYRPSLYEKVPKSGSSYHRLYNTHDGPSIYENILELWFVKNVLGEPQCCVTCVVNKETGAMIPLPEQYKELIQ
jgi:replicative DNA helicase